MQYIIMVEVREEEEPIPVEGDERTQISFLFCLTCLRLNSAITRHRNRYLA